jgi:hypothetical protein
LVDQQSSSSSAPQSVDVDTGKLTPLANLRGGMRLGLTRTMPSEKWQPARGYHPSRGRAWRAIARPFHSSKLW